MFEAGLEPQTLVCPKKPCAKRYAPELLGQNVNGLTALYRSFFNTLSVFERRAPGWHRSTRGEML